MLGLLRDLKVVCWAYSLAGIALVIVAGKTWDGMGGYWLPCHPSYGMGSSSSILSIPSLVTRMMGCSARSRLPIWLQHHAPRNNKRCPLLEPYCWAVADPCWEPGWNLYAVILGAWSGDASSYFSHRFGARIPHVISHPLSFSYISPIPYPICDWIFHGISHIFPVTSHTIGQILNRRRW